MIYFVHSRQSFDQLVASTAWPPSALWVSLGVLERAELEALRISGIAVTDLNKAIDPNDATALADVIDTIREHHPGQVLWLDGSAAA
ncbi:MAG: hypothetical protein EON85_10265 [Brevundimonas sp.]|nr:MAG: hypothetical protein EON85_10265 [Brevundimonas sp.]